MDITNADQDSDMLYVTSQPAIVDCARRFYIDYPTIVNQIPKDKNVYDNTPLDYARLDNNLAKSQLAIGLSSNLAQIAQSYSYTFNDEKYQTYTCILSILAQVAIDNTKRRYDIDIEAAIKAIKDDLDIRKNGYPKFWQLIKGRSSPNYSINKNIHCPMNYLIDMKYRKTRKSTPTIPISEFFVRFPLETEKWRSRRIESMISRYALSVYKGYTDYTDDSDDEDYIVIRSDFDRLIDDIRKTHISHSYIGLMSWLIDRAFTITPRMCMNAHVRKSTLFHNRSLLIKVLYRVNPKDLLLCFSGHLGEKNAEN